ncbi:unnamed protein product [Linum trigynum]|uniref:Reverse transcriptase/retrotransposon-derived protein RNase H-like domain-containing protein n=1 Tax=Linum trigynum TaxID=586398 RepID=A0AAV2GMA9_9ROSI
MTEWPTPTNVTELHGFLGLTGYYHKFVWGYGSIARPLTNLLKKSQFEWTQTTAEAFQHLKTTMTTTPVLTIPNFEVPFDIEIDALGVGIEVLIDR